MGERLLCLNGSPVRDRSFGYWIRAWLPVLLGVAIIATESTTNFGPEHTSRPLRWVFEHLFGPVSNGRWDMLHHYIRKTGHFLGYGLIGLAWVRAWWMTFPRWSFLHSSLLALTGTALMASSDELHQAFLPNRTGMFRDVVLDCCGAIVLQLLAYFILRLFRPRELARAA